MAHLFHGSKALHPNDTYYGYVYHRCNNNPSWIKNYENLAGARDGLLTGLRGPYTSLRGRIDNITITIDIGEAYLYHNRTFYT